MRTRSTKGSGSTILEAMMAVAVVAVFLVGLYQMNARAMGLLKSGLEGVSGTRILVNTLERVRAATWDQVIDPTYLSGLLSSGHRPGHLPNVIVTISLEALVPSGASRIEVSRAADGTVTIVSSGDGTIATRGAARADITISWRTTFNSIHHSRTMTAFLGKTGILGRNQ
jgi:hypothetical protein